MKQEKRIKLNDAHLWHMVDDTGMFQHAKFDIPNLKEGYTTDDNARLLMMAAIYYESTGKKEYLNWCYRAASFLQYACKDGWFRNFMAYDRNFLEKEGSQDCFGRCIWCLGYVTSRIALPDGLRALANELLHKVTSSAQRLVHLRSSAYAVLGFALWREGDCNENLAEHLARIASCYHSNVKPGWFWYEDEMTYCNATMPHALLAGYQAIGGEKLLKIGLESLDFLLEATTRDGFFWPVGCHGWSKRGADPALYDQQPVEACSTLLACLKAHELTGDNAYREKAELCLEWFLGNNSAGVPMIDSVSGGCYDGIERTGPNLNQGAESLLSWYVSALVMENYGVTGIEKP